MTPPRRPSSLGGVRVVAGALLALAAVLLLLHQVGPRSAGDAPQLPGPAPTWTSAVTAPAGTAGPTEELSYLDTGAPASDLADLAVRLGGLSPDLAVAAASPTAPEECTLGQRAPFWVHDIQNQRYFQVEAVVRQVTANTCVWVEEGQPFDAEGLEKAASTFSDEIIPEIRRQFGSEWSPGVDGNRKIHVLHHRDIPGVAGFFTSSDEVPAWVNRYSNARELFYVNLSTRRPGSYDYLSLLAHEFQHMVQYNLDRDESGWVNEGLSEVATHLVGYGEQTGAAFFAEPDTPLLEWEPEGSNLPHYAASYAFLTYLRARFGDDAIRLVAQAPGNSRAGVLEALASLGYHGSFEELFADWSIANTVGGLTDGPAVDPRYDYKDKLNGAVDPEPLPPEGVRETVAQYAADYYDVTAQVADSSLRMAFAGDATVDLLPPPAAGSGAPVWWSGRGDNEDRRLDLVLDLSRSSEPSLAFSMWYDLETNWDWGYLSASTDGGVTWQRLPTQSATDEDPNGTNYGGGVTGTSSGWLQEAVPLSGLGGRTVLVRFETVTDDTVSLTGMALADLRVEDAGGSSPVAANAYRPEGWIQVAPRLPQRWEVQLVVTSADGVDAVPVPVAADGSADLALDGVPGDATVTLVVGATTPGTRQPAAYQVLPGRS